MKYSLFLLSFWVFGLQAQSSKLNTQLHILLEETALVNYPITYVPALVKGNLKTIEQIVNNASGEDKYKYGVKNIASVNISLATVRELLKNRGVQRIEYKETLAHQLTHFEDSIMLKHNNALAAHDGWGVLPQGYRGEGVLLGMIDDGIEWQHPDFLNANGSTRILHLWDQNSTDANYFEPYFSYGASWDSMDLNRYQCTHLAGDHGSHVMGTAGGNGLASGKFVGIAPEADIACVAIRNSSFLSSFVDGLYYIFRQADTTGKPCVVNSSVGAYTSGHDSQDLYAQLVENILEVKPGRALIQAGGNARAFAMHLGATLQNSTTKTWFSKSTGSYYTDFALYADTSDFQQIDFSLQLINPTTYQVEAQTNRYNILRDFNIAGNVGQVRQILFNNPDGQAVELEIYVDQYEDSYEVYFRIGSSINNGYWQLTTQGTGKYDIWSEPSLTGTAQMLQDINVPHYNSPDSIQSIVGYWTTSDKVITVGAYQNRDYHIDYAGDSIALYTTGFPKSGIAAFSSLGPTRKGDPKPDITAPGGQVLSAFSISTLNFYRQTLNPRLNQDGWHVVNRGTSMSAPMVAGAVALYLQCKPYANYADIKQALQNSARLDSFVFAQNFALPNIHWGYGKLDVYELLKSCLIYGCTDTLAINYNPLATVADSSCGYLISTIKSVPNTTTQLDCSPNPAQHQIQIQYHLSSGLESTTKSSLEITDILGQVVWQQKLTASKGTLDWQKGDLPTGIYFIVIRDNGQISAVRQVVFM